MRVLSDRRVKAPKIHFAIWVPLDASDIANGRPSIFVERHKGEVVLPWIFNSGSPSLAIQIISDRALYYISLPNIIFRQSGSLISKPG